MIPCRFFKATSPPSPKFLQLSRFSIWGQQKVTQVQCACRTDLHLGFPRVFALSSGGTKQKRKGSLFKRKQTGTPWFYCTCFFFHKIYRYINSIDTICGYTVCYLSCILSVKFPMEHSSSFAYFTYFNYLAEAVSFPMGVPFPPEQRIHEGRRVAIY